MTLQATGVLGRESELAVLENALDRVAGGVDQHVLTVVRGGVGVGKSALLAEVALRWRDRGVRVLSVAFADTAPAWDQFGVSAFVAAVQRDFEEFAGPGVANSVEALRRLCVAASYETPQRQSVLLFELAKLFARIARGRSLVLLADNVEVLASPALALAPACRPGCLVVASARSTDGAAAHLELDHVADQVISLDLLPEDCVGPLLAKLVGAPLDTGALTAVRDALGPLGRHPGTLLSTVDGLREDGRLTVVQGRACLAGDRAILLPADHALIGHVGPFGSNGRHLMALAATCVRFSVDDLPALAGTTGRDLAEYGPAVDLLVRMGALECAEDGRLTCPCPALADRLVADARAKVAKLHGAIATHLLAGDESAVDRLALADHIAQAGALLSPTPGHADLLLAQADRLPDDDVTRIATWYRAALHHLDRDDSRRRAIMADLARLLLRIGRTDWLAEMLADEPLDAELAAAATIAALCTSTLVPPTVAAVLPAAAAFAERWFAGEPLTGPAELAWCAPLAAPGPRPVASDADLAEATEMVDLVTLLRSLIGVGPVAGGSRPGLYHQLIRQYHAGDWDSALSTARRLELSPAGHSTLPAVARLLAAEICAEQGNPRRTADWLQGAGNDHRFAALRGWVDSGVHWRAGDHDAAFETGWQALMDIAPEPTQPGRAWLLDRLAVIAADGGRPDRAAKVLAAIEPETAVDDRTLLLLQGVATHDLAVVRTAADTARRHGRRPELLAICLVAAELADDARPWLHEAHDLARRLGAPTARARVRALMRHHGVAAPKATARPVTLSDTEVRIAELIRGGRTNRQIAVALLMSEKTVEYHLSRLFAKTGARTRVGLATATVRGALDQISA